jgi:hypothetical protein
MKTTVLSVLFVLGALVTHSQDTLKTYLMETGHWQAKKKAWEYDPEPAFSYEVFKIEQGKIYSNLNTYTLTSELMDRRHNITWNATDQNGKECLVSISDNRGRFFLAIIYGETCYRYHYYVR